MTDEEIQQKCQQANIEMRKAFANVFGISKTTPDADAEDALAALGTVAAVILVQWAAECFPETPVLCVTQHIIESAVELNAAQIRDLQAEFRAH